MKIVVNITCWRRPNYLEKTILALKECYNYNNFLYRVLVDAGYPYQQKLMKEIITKHNFKCEFFVHDKRMGCAGNVGHAFLSSFDTYKADAVIMLEDDTVPSKDFLVYMSDMLEIFSEDKNIWSITGYNRRVHRRYPGSSDHHSISIGLGKKDVIFSRGCFTKMGGWGSWARCRNEIGNEWFGIHWNHRDGISENSCPRGKEFLNYIIKDDTGSWAWPMCMYWRGNRKEIAPDLSRIQNIGEDAGMFAPGGDWHKNNHHSEIWMDGKNFIPSEEYKWKLGECSQNIASRKNSSFDKLSSSGNKIHREIKRISNQIQSFTFPVFDILKDFSLRILYILESLEFYSSEKHKSKNTKKIDLTNINVNLYKLTNPFLEEVDAYNVINFGPSQTGLLQKYEPSFNKLYSIDFSFEFFSKRTAVQKQSEFKVCERVNYCNFYAKRFENIGLIYSFDALKSTMPTVTKRLIITMCNMLCRNGVGILHISFKRNKIGKIKGLLKTNSFLSENDLVAIIQNEKCTIIDIYNSNFMNLSGNSDSLFFVFRKNR